MLKQGSTLPRVHSLPEALFFTDGCCTEIGERVDSFMPGASDPETVAASRERRRVALAVKATVQQLSQVIGSCLEAVERKIDRLLDLTLRLLKHV